MINGNDDDLFAGVQIMSAQELNQSIASGEGDTTGEIVNDGTIQILPPDRSKIIETPDTTVEGNTDNTNVSTNSSTNLDEDRKESVYKALLSEMVKEGVLSLDEADKLEELPGSFDTVKALMEKTVSKKFDSKQEEWKNSLSKDKKRFLEIENAFDSDDIAIEMTKKLEFFDTITPETLSDNVELQKTIYREFLLAKGYTAVEANEEIEDADALGKLDDKASKALPHLRKEATEYVDKARNSKLESIEKDKVVATQKFDNLIKSIDAQESFIDGIALNKVAKDKLRDNIIKPVHTDANGRQYNSLMYKQHQNPAGFELMINYLDSIGIFNMDKAGNFKPDISKLKNVAKTAAVNELDKVIAQNDTRPIGRNSALDGSSDKTKDLANWLEGAFGETKKKK